MDESSISEWLGQTIAPIRRSGVMTKQEVAEALTAYLTNAQSLFEESRLLHSAGRISRCCSLCVLGLEELAKVPILVRTYLSFEHGVDQKAWEAYWKGGSHKSKQEMIMAYGKIIRGLMDGDPMFSKRLYRFYATEELFAHLDRFKQQNFYVDIREDGIHFPSGGQEQSKVFDYLVTFGQERADSFKQWHITTRRSLEYLDVAMGKRSVSDGTPSMSVEEVEADILYQANFMSASIVPDYAIFTDFMIGYARKPSEKNLAVALLNLAREFRGRTKLNGLPNFQSRNIGILKLLISLSQSNCLNKSLARKLDVALSQSSS